MSNSSWWVRPLLNSALGGYQSLPSEDIAVKRGGSLDVVNVQDDVPELLDLHALKLTRAASGETGGAGRAIRRD
jgi:hypothetical protein